MPEDEDSERGFKVEDKRRFTETGEARDSERDEAAEAAAEDAPPESPAATGDAAAADQAEAGPRGERTAEISFSSFAFGLASQALMFLGVAPDPHTGVIHKDLAQARAMIDILVMLREKTAGNLSDDEDRMMEEMLYELQMQYVREVRGDAPTEGDN